jgi:hypothetical protein
MALMPTWLLRALAGGARSLCVVTDTWRTMLLRASFTPADNKCLRLTDGMTMLGTGAAGCWGMACPAGAGMA